MSGLKEKAKALKQILWDKRLEFDKWLQSGISEYPELTEEFNDLWVRLEDAEQEIEEIHRKYEGLISKAEKDCADCYQELKQKLQQKYDECKRIEETTASPLWREGARWNMKLIEELLEKEAKT
jgi:predicted nuclease with TOPRIM domain